jgi:hypothetical protein
MAKIIGFIRRRDDLDFAAFSQHWRTTHRTHALKLDRWLKGYVQNHLRPGPIDDMQRPADGCPVLWVDRADDMVELAASDAFRTGAYLDEPLFMEGRSSGLPVEERVIITADPAATVKAMLFLRLRDRATAIDAPHACGQVRNLALGRNGLDLAFAFDLVEELWWRDAAAYAADRPAIAALAQAEWIDIAGSRAALVDELVVIPRP